jgi:hypothetical protein
MSDGAKYPETMLLKLPLGMKARMREYCGGSGVSGWVRGLIERELSVKKGNGGVGVPAPKKSFASSVPDAPKRSVDGDREARRAAMRAEYLEKDCAALLGVVRDRSVNSAAAERLLGVPSGRYRAAEAALLERGEIWVEHGLLEVRE